MYRLIALRHNERSRAGEVNEEERGSPPLRKQRLSKKRFALLIGLFLLALFPNSGPPAVASPRVSGEITAHEVTMSLPAANATLTRQGGGTVNGADAGQTGGETLLYSSPTISAGQLYDNVGVHWVAARGTEDSFYVELRTSADAASWSDWQLLTADEDMANTDTNEWYAAPQVAVDNARYAQYRVWLTDGNPGNLQRVGLTFMDVNDLNAGPVARFVGDIVGAAKDVARSFTEPTSANAAINATRILTRTEWAADEKLMQWVPRYPQRVLKAVVHHTVTGDGGNGQVAAAIRAIYYYHAVTRGWGDIGYSYIVDKYGNVWTGRQGGDNTEAGHAYGWNKGSIGIAALGTYSVTQPSSAMVASIANIIAMKFTQFGVQPYGSDSFVHQEQARDGTWVNVTSNPPNVQGHRDCNYIQSQYGGQTACPGNALYAQLTNVRQMAQAAVINGYNQMPFIETALPKAGYPGANLTVGVTVANRGKTSIPAGTRVSYRLLQGATTVVAQGATATIAADIVPGATGGVNVPFTVPAIGNYIVRWDLQTGSTWWNTAYGTPVREQYFRGADWSVDWVSDNVPISWTAGETKMINVTLANDGGRVWNSAGAGPVQLGYKWVSNATGNTFPGTTRVSLPADVQPGQTITLQIPVTAPVYPTNYTMSLDLYKQNEFAFADKGVADNDTNTGVSVDFKAGYTFNATPQFTAGQTTSVPVTIRNMGNGTFPTTSAFPVNLSYHWTTASGASVLWDGARTPIGGDLLSGQSVTVNAAVTAPTTGGSFVLKLDLVQEGVAWFSVKGATTGNLSISLAGPQVASFGANYAILPLTGTASSRTTVPITLGNTSNFNWPAAGANPVTLSYHWINSAGKTVVWDGLRTKLTADVPPGQLTQVQADLAFPSAPGTYTLRWDLVQEGVSWFSGKGVRMAEQSVSVQPYVAPFFGASLGVDQTPATMNAKATVLVPVKIENMSNFDWGTNVNLSYHWYDAAGNLVAWDGLRTPLAGTPRTHIAAVNAQIAVPSTPGTYRLRYDIVQEGVAWFSGQGMQTPIKQVSVIVPPLSALYNAPATVNGQVNSMITVPVTITNAGSMTWQPGAFNASYHLYVANGPLFVWDGVRTALPAAVAPNETVTVNLIVKVPAAVGTYLLRLDVVQEGVAWFSGQGVPMGSATLQAQ
jgi:N-acetylmuramoyl-L-alanine amidase-like protein